MGLPAVVHPHVLHPFKAGQDPSPAPRCPRRLSRSPSRRTLGQVPTPSTGFGVSTSKISFRMPSGEPSVTRVCTFQLVSRQSASYATTEPSECATTTRVSVLITSSTRASTFALMSGSCRNWRTCRRPNSSTFWALTSLKNRDFVSCRSARCTMPGRERGWPPRCPGSSALHPAPGRCPAAGRPPRAEPLLPTRR